MKALRRRWLLLLLVASAWAQEALVSVTCGHAWLSVAVPVGVVGSRVAKGELTLGSGCGVTAADGDNYQLEHPLGGCGTTLEILPDSIRYSNVLHYRPSAGGPVARARPFSLPVSCSYPRTGRVSSQAVQPTWISSSSTIAQRRPLSFALEVYDSSWSSPLHQPMYSLGDLINIEASVRPDVHLPLKVFVDECVASPRATPGSRYKVIVDNGCLLDGQLSRSRFLLRRHDRALRFQLDTLLFPNISSSQLYLRCHLRAVAEGAASTSGRSCSYNHTEATWRSPDGANCSCCGSPGGCGGRRQRRLAGDAGLLEEGNVHLGPLLLSALPSSPPVLPTALETSTAPPQRPSAPVVREKKRDSGLDLPIPATTLVLVAMGCVLVAVGMAGCYCSLRRWRLEGSEAALGEPRDVAMGPTMAGGGPGDHVVTSVGKE